MSEFTCLLLSAIYLLGVDIDEVYVEHIIKQKILISDFWPQS